MKTFNDLKFEKHSIANTTIGKFNNAKQAVEKFNNGYGVSVIFGACFYSDGVDTYEVAVLFNDSITYNTDITNDVLGYLSQQEVSEVMIKVQKL